MPKSNKKKGKSSRKLKKLSVDIVLRYLSQRNEPANTKSIAETLGRVGKDGRQEAFEILELLRDDGKVQQLSKHRWAMPHAIKEHRGRVVGHVDGHGYVLTEGTHEKVFLRAHDMREALHNDIVTVRVSGRDKRKKLFGKIIDIIERGNTLVVGRYFKESNSHFVVPEDQRIAQDIFVLEQDIADAEVGQVVTVEITQHPSPNFQPVGKIVEVLGDHLAPGMEIEIALRKHQLPKDWPAQVLQQVERYGASIDKADIADRKDIRHLPLVTIDGEDARDFDDAVYCEALANNRSRLLVAIADVSNYVKEASALDQEAWQRGTSVYFPNNVIPMLPEVLSNGLCSLNPQVDRFCFVCDMEIDAKGNIESYDFYQAVMHSHARLTYTQVSALLAPQDASKPEHGIDHALIPAIKQLNTVADKLGKCRRQTGTIEFDIPEPLIIFNDDRKIERVVARERNIAHKLIEECMLAANICASLFLDDSQAVGIYRVHEQPDADKIDEVRLFLRQFKVLLGGGDEPSPRDFAEVISKVDDPLTAKIVQTSLLRSMKQARYATENEGHFALNFDSYTHFTSPIRRYSDLVVHRQIRRLLAKPDLQDSKETLVKLEQAAEQASMTERRAESASREVTQWLKCEFMSHKIAKEFTGVVVSVTDFGLFVELEEFYIDGLVHITALGQDYYRFDADRRRLIGEHSGREYKTGDRLKVQLSRVDMEQGRIDFDLSEVKNERFSNSPKKRLGGQKRSHVKKGSTSKKAAKPNKGKRKGKKHL